MKLSILGGPEDIQEIIAPLVDYMGEKLKITVEPCPIEENEPRKFCVEVETKKNAEKEEWQGEMQLRLWGTLEENQEMIEVLKSNLGEKVKIISAPYSSASGLTQRIYIEIDLQNQNYRKYPIDKILRK